MKRKLIMMFILVVIISTSCVLVGCGNGDGNDTTVKYTVTFNASGGTLTGNETVSVDDGGLITGAPTAKRTGYTFDGWFLATSGGTAINLATYTVTDDVTLYAQWTQKEKHTVTLASGCGVTFVGGGMVAQLTEDETLPEIENVLERKVAGWWSDSNFWTNENFMMPDNDLTITPYFQKPDGYLDLVPLGEQWNTGKPNKLSLLLEENFIPNGAINENNVVVYGGEGEFVEAGKLVQYNGEMPKGAEFRVNSIVDTNTKVVIKGVSHTFRYNFENKGTETIDLILYQVNDGKNIEPGDNGHRIYLQPGESMTLEFFISFTLGSNNKNALTFMRVNADTGMNGMILGMSMSIKLGAA